VWPPFAPEAGPAAPPTPPRERAERNRRAALARRAAKRAQQRSDLDVDRLLAEPSPYVAMPPPEAPLARRARRVPASETSSTRRGDGVLGHASFTQAAAPAPRAALHAAAARRGADRGRVLRRRAARRDGLPPVLEGRAREAVLLSGGSPKTQAKTEE
jgi:hypothetical protein